MKANLHKARVRKYLMDMSNIVLITAIFIITAAVTKFLQPSPTAAVIHWVSLVLIGVCLWKAALYTYWFKRNTKDFD